MDLTVKKCVPCEGGVAPLNDKEVKVLIKELNPDWRIIENMKLSRELLLVNYKHTIDFVNKVAALAEQEGHHPDMHVYYGRIVIEIWTHSINGLSENDFILSAKIDKL